VSSPSSKRKASAFITDFQNRDLAQIEQLQRLVAAARSIAASKRTAPQWQLP
jgi:hypothetical protein